jgi:FMN phosphatase YigB (HAD superfamily)
MKLISDFDDVLFANTLKFKVHLFNCLEEAGVPRTTAENEYRNVRITGVPFSLKRFLALMAVKHSMDMETMRGLYEKILMPSKDFLNLELIEIIKNIGKDNCYLVTNGEEQYQKDKLEKTEVSPLFKEVYIVPESKKEIIEKICFDNQGEKVIFIEDRMRFIEDLDMAKLTNLKVILFDEVGLEKLKMEIKEN